MASPGLTHGQILHLPQTLEWNLSFECPFICYIVQDTDRTVQAPRVTGYFAPQVYLPSRLQCFMQLVVVVVASMPPLRKPVYSVIPSI